MKLQNDELEQQKSLMKEFRVKVDAFMLNINS